MKTKVLFAGQHPMGFTGNSGMMQSVLDAVDKDTYDISVVADYSTSVDLSAIAFERLPYPVRASMDPRDPDGSALLVRTLRNSSPDILVTVGMDLWQYASVIPEISNIRKKNPFKWISIFPYDLDHIREDWIDIIRQFDFPYVYSEFGEQMLKPHISNIRYFRPPLRNHSFFVPFSSKQKKEYRRKLLPSVPDDGFVFGFVGVNQFRKDPQKVLKAFKIACEKMSGLYLYMHTEFGRGVYNLNQACIDYGFKDGQVIRKPDGAKVLSERLPWLYNAFDCYVNCSLQEGLSWTVVESMLCGVPVIASDSTAHKELLSRGAGHAVRCNEDALIPLYTASGPGFIDVKACKAEDIASAMVRLASNEGFRDRYSTAGLEKMRGWLKGVSDINEVIKDAEESLIEVLKTDLIDDAVLFAQHSAAGDVLMTTRCFKGIKERFPGKTLHYMTSPQYMGVLEGNPYIDMLIPWDDGFLNGRYKVVLNPHGDRILPGHWGRNCNSILSDFYWKILDVEPDDFFIQRKDPGNNVPDQDDGVYVVRNFINQIKGYESEPIKLAVVHTTGGDHEFRTYKYMAEVCEWLDLNRYVTVQLGGKNDYSADANLDLRGKLSYTESAWVMEHADLAITVDSFMSHLAGAIGVDQVCLFGAGNAAVVKPTQIEGQLICLSPDYVRDCPGLGPCSGAVKDCPVKCTGSHDPKDIIKAIERIEEVNK